MAATLGNRFWEFRAKHGRDQLFADSDLLWAEAVRYFEWYEKNKLIAIEFNGKDAIECEVPKMRAMSMIGFCTFLGVNHGYFSDFKKRLKPKKKEDQAFLEVIERIEGIIYCQKFEGAAAGLLNGNIIARELGLVEKQEQKVDSKVANTFNGKVEVIHRTTNVPLGTDPYNAEA